MLMSVIEGALSAPTYPEIAGKRVLITGITASRGVDIVRAFADHKARLVLQFAETGEKTEAICEVVAPAALDIKAYPPIGSETDAVTAFAKKAVQAFGGLDAVINLVPLDAVPFVPLATVSGIEQIIGERLAVPYLLSTIAANRMSLMLTEGLVLNVATLPAGARGAAHGFAAVLKASLTGMTRAQAKEWSPRGICFNAIAPQVAFPASEPALDGEPEVAATALYLASGRGRSLSGLVFEARTR
jgi:NAD(P)-dependent dehydrogenase (short-subunit alcohol dehydrogenase family)